MTGDNAPAASTDFFAPDVGPTGPELLEAFLERRPAQLATALGQVVPAPLHEEIGIASWGWIIKLLEGGLYYEIAWEIIDIASHRGFFLKTKDWFPSVEEFRELVKHTGIDEKFNDRCRLYLGSQEFRAVVEGYLFTEMRKGTDPALQVA